MSNHLLFSGHRGRCPWLASPEPRLFHFNWVKLLFVFIASCLQVPSFAQETGFEVHGRVVSEMNSEPLPGVSVAVKGASRGTVTDMDGNYSLMVPGENSTLIFSFIGFISQEFSVNTQTTINVVLKEDVKALDEVVVTGYSTERKVDLTGAVSVVETEIFENNSVANPIKLLQGQVPGVFIKTDGAPSGGAQVRIRGVSTLNNNDPLYIIDGVPTKSSAFQVLQSSDIESMQVLKDASSAAIYGARASNGVIIITTKQAQKNQFTLNYSSKITQSSYVTQPDVLSAEERARVQWQASINAGLDPDNDPYVQYEWDRNADGTAVLNKVTMPEYLSEGVRSANTNWFDAISRTGIIQEHNLSMSTGSERGGALISLGYFKNKYIEKFKDFDKISVRINSHHNFFEGKVKIGENLTITNGVENGHFSTSSFSEALQIRPVLPIKTDDGNYSGPLSGGFVDHPNPLMVLDHNKWDQENDVNMFGNLYANISFLENLTLNTSFGIEKSNTQIRDIQRVFSTGFISRSVNSLKNTKRERFNWNLNSVMQYDLEVEKHKAIFLAGTEAIRNKYSDNSTYKEDFAVENLDYFVESAGSGMQLVTGSRTGFALLSYFGKINYSFNDKYLATATFRYDGSSRFGSNNHFGAFPAFSGGWRLSQEDFIADNFPVISNLKLRAGWGKVGNQEISNIARYGLYQPHYGESAIAFNPDNGTAYDIAGNDSGPLPSGFRRIQSGNENLRWETTTETNVGLDFGFNDQKIIGSFDYFARATNDILISPAYLAIKGEGGNRFVNGASLETNGFEVSLSYRNQLGALNYSLTGNVGHYRDKITELPSNVIHSYPGNSEKTILGRSMHSSFGYITDGLFQNQGEVDAHATQPGKGIGRIRYKDLNADGVINPLDQEYIGVSAPDYEYGLNLQAEYKGFNLRIFFQGVQGISVYDSRKRFTDFTGLWAGTNYGKRTLDAWTPLNTGSTIPAVTLSDNNNEGRSSTYFVSNGSYLKLRQVSLGYTLYNALFSKMINVFLTGENLMTFKDTKGANAFTSPDPENPGYGFPRPLKVTLGVSLSL